MKIWAILVTCFLLWLGDRPLSAPYARYSGAPRRRRRGRGRRRASRLWYVGGYRA